MSPGNFSTKSGDGQGRLRLGNLFLHKPHLLFIRRIRAALLGAADG